MKILELFSGTQSISREFRAKGHYTTCIDVFNIFAIEQITMDIMDFNINKFIKTHGTLDVIWASPPCQTHSIAAISKHRQKLDNGLLVAKSEKAKEHDNLLLKTLQIIQITKPKYYFIENPRGGMRKSALMQGLYRYTITYCQYGDSRMKPTDIWTNYHNPNFKTMCKNGDSCHVSAPRGSKTGTQGLKNRIERSRIPPEFCKYIVEISEK